jgi:hypothetical protein
MPDLLADAARSQREASVNHPFQTNRFSKHHSKVKSLYLFLIMSLYLSGATWGDWKFDGHPEQLFAKPVRCLPANLIVREFDLFGTNPTRRDRSTAVR